MPFTVTAPTIPLHEEHKFYRGEIREIHETEGNYGPQLKWIIVLDEDRNAMTDEEGNPKDKETWTWCSAKLTTHEKNKFRRWVKGLTGSEPAEGQLVDEQDFVGRRVGVMFTHTIKNGETKEYVEHIVDESKLD